jgi:FG-GAP-like repeat/FG-GAP repeat
MRRFLLNAAAVAFILLISVSCSTTKKAIPPVTETVPPPRAAEPVKPPSAEYKTIIRCKEDTEITFNSCGISALPFIRPFFYDMYGDGRQEMIAGSKDGSLRLYERIPGAAGGWTLVPHYFEGVRAGAFSAAAAGDIDGDGKPEILLGTGGFSSDSGRVLVYRNSGTLLRPLWEKVPMREIKVGNDATPSLADVDGDGMPDLIVGNSTGNLFFFRNESAEGRVSFVRDNSCFRNVHLGMYAAPAATVSGTKVVVIAGNSVGKLYMLEKSQGRKCSWREARLGIGLSSFAAPAFVVNRNDQKEDLVVSDGDGMLHYFRDEGNYLRWEETSSLFSGRILPGPACAPAVASVGGRPAMVVGNIYGKLKLYEAVNASGSLPWAEKADFFKGLKLRGFSRGLLTVWEGRELLVTGEQDGLLRAFLNLGSFDNPVWAEQKEFFISLPKMEHAAPTVFDIDGDGKWELIVGDAGGRVRAFRYETGEGGMPRWSEIRKLFSDVKVDRFATPTLYRDSGRLWLLAGEQDGRIITYVADRDQGGWKAFHENGVLDGIRVNNNSSPSAAIKNGLIGLSVGDYDGNLSHFVCTEERVEVVKR